MKIIISDEFENIIADEQMVVDIEQAMSWPMPHLFGLGGNFACMEMEISPEGEEIYYIRQPTEDEEECFIGLR